MPSHTVCLLAILIVSSLRIGLPSSLFLQVFPSKPCVHLSSRLKVPHGPAHPIFHHFLTQTIFGEKYRLWKSSLCSFFQSLVTSSLLGPYNSSAPYSTTPSAYVRPSVRETKFYTHTKQQTKLLLFIVLSSCLLNSKLKAKATGNKFSRHVHNLTCT